MLHHYNPTQAIRLIFDLGIFNIVFEMPQNVPEIPDIGLLTVNSMDIMTNIIHSNWYHTENEDRYLHFLIALFIFYGELKYVKKGKEFYVANYILEYSIKFGRHEMNTTKLILDSIPLWTPFFEPLLNNQGEPSRLTLGRIITFSKELWRLSLISALISSFVRVDTSYHDVVEVISTLYNNLLLLIHNYKLDQSEYSWKLKPLVNGKELAEILCIKPGPIFGKITAAQKDWQLEYPDGTKEECIDFLRSFYSQL